MAKGKILYRGPSLLDGKPIVVIATIGSKNVKTGNMVQTWILRDRVSPIQAVANGGDSSICGDCKHRGNGDGSGRTCYVTWHIAPQQVWRSFKAGRYSADWDSQTFAGMFIRLGAYGDPAAVPVEVWDKLVSQSNGWTGYSHQWRNRPQYKHLLMASVDNEIEYRAARDRGWRTFRIRGENDSILSGEFMCPASKEAGNKKLCIQCRACDGNSRGESRGTPVIIVHGNKHNIKHYKTTALTIGGSLINKGVQS